MRSKIQAGADLQDAWHYFASITGDDGVFGREARSLKGRVTLYENGRNTLTGVLEFRDEIDQLDDDILDLPYVDDIEDERALKRSANRGRVLTERLAEDLGIDAQSGEPLETR